MYFFKVEGQQIAKYRVTIDKNELQRIRRQIINECSIITEGSSVGSHSFKVNDSDKMFSVTRGEFVRMYDEEQGPTYPLYRYYYKERTYSEMVKWIDALLSGNEKILSKICFGKPEEKQNNFDVKLESLIKKGCMISDLDYYKKLALLNEIRDVVRTIELNTETKPEFYYYDELLSVLNPTLDSVISKDDFERTLGFLGKSTEELGMVFVDSIPNIKEKSLNYKKD